MGIGVGYTATSITPGENGSLPREECARMAGEALAIARKVLLEAGIHHGVNHFDATFESTGVYDSFGFSITLLGPGAGCMDIMYRWLRFPESSRPEGRQWDGGHYAKTQFASDPHLTHLTLCKIAAEWTRAGLAEDPWDDLDYIREKDSQKVQDGMDEFLEELGDLAETIADAGAPVILRQPGGGADLISPLPAPPPGKEEREWDEDDLAECEALARRARTAIKMAMQPGMREDLRASHAAITLIDRDMNRISDLAIMIAATSDPVETRRRIHSHGGIMDALEELHGAYAQIHTHLRREFPHGPPDAPPDQNIADLMTQICNLDAVQDIHAEMLTRKPGDRIQEACRRTLLALADESEEAGRRTEMNEERRSAATEPELRMLRDARAALDRTGRIAEAHRAEPGPQ